MKSFLQTAAGIATAALIGLLLGARIMLDLIGYTTAPDDFALFRQRLPNVLEWLFSTPWWVPSLLMAGLVALAAWLIVSGTRHATAETIEERTGVERSDVESMIDARLEGLPRSDGQADLATQADIHRHDEKLVEVDGAVQIATKSLAALNERMGEIAKGCFDLEQRWNDWTAQNTRQVDARFDQVDAGFAAISNREWHLRLFAELARDFDALAGPVDAGLGLIDGEGWLNSLKAWRGKLEQWLVIADYYAMNTRENVLAVPEHLYDGPWTFDEKVLTAHQVHRFKEASIWWMSAKAAKPRVDRCLAAAAFESPSKKGRQDSPPRPSADR